MLDTKAKVWLYENEMRMYLKLLPEQKHRNFYFAEFDENIQPSEMILGPRCCVPASEIEDATNGYSPPIKIVQAMLSPSSFEVVSSQQ
jgi:hypothetical protein